MVAKFVRYVIRQIATPLWMLGAATKIFFLPHLSPRVKFILFKKDELFFTFFGLYLTCA